MRRIFMLLLFFVSIVFPGLVSPQIPLQIGNRWDFVMLDWDGTPNSRHDTLSISIYADSTIEDKKYYRVTQNYWIHDLVRSDTVGVYFYDINNKKEWLFFQFNLPVGNYIQNGYKLSPLDINNFIQVYKNRDDTTFLFNQPIKRLGFHIIKSIDNAYSIDINLQFGFLYIFVPSPFSTQYINLIGCQIDGKVYGTLTTVKNQIQIVDEYRLLQNYPNPFNPTTEINYSVPKQSNVTIKIFDALGREISTLVNEEKSAGTYKLNYNPVGLSNGIYFYQMKANDFIETKKMIVLR